MAWSYAFNLSWKKSKQIEKNTDVITKTAKESKEMENFDAPPPYSECPSQDRNEDDLSDRNASYPILTKFAEQDDLHRRSHLHWILVDIVAVTFSTDVGRLRRALLKTDPTWASLMVVEDTSSMLDEERKLLAIETCALVRYLQREVAQSRWLLIHPKLKYLATKMIVEPTQDVELDLDFALELMGSFERRKGCKRPESSLLGYWMKWPHSTSLGDVMASHVLLLQSLKLEKEVRVVLEDYVETFQKENGLEELCTSKELQDESFLPEATSCWPLSDEYMDLARSLRSLKTTYPIHDPYEASRTRLIERRSLGTEKRA